MTVAVRLALVVALLAGQTPVCKVAAARSLTRAHTTTPTPAAPTCKKGCCAAAEQRPAPAPPVRDHGPPKPPCPADCLSPLCSPAPLIETDPSAAVAHDTGATGHLPAASCPSPGKGFRSTLDRPPRA